MSGNVRLLGLCLLAACIGSSVCSAASEGPVLIVAPARQQVLSVALDVAALRPAYIVSYQNVGRGVDPFMHVWDSSAKTWRETNPDFYSQGLHFSVPPTTVYLLGAADEAPGVLQTRQSWCNNQKHLSKLDVVSLLNDFSDDLDFSASEWKWLARRHKLELKDLNEQRRRYGRYGPPKRAQGIAPAAPQVLEPTGNVEQVKISENVTPPKPVPAAVPAEPVTPPKAEAVLDVEPQSPPPAAAEELPDSNAPEPEVVIDPGSK